MSDLFLKIINMSISAGWIVLAVLLLRFALKKAPKWVNVLLWAIVAVRLICPFSIESALSLIPSTETISPGIMMEQTPAIQTGVPAINSVVNPVIGQSFAPTPGASANPLQIWIPILAIIWAVGIAALLIYAAVSYWRLRRKVSEAVILRDNIFQSENVASPFVLGIIKPRIYLPYHIEEQDLTHVVAHEQAHIKRRDHWWKPLGFLLLTIHWFNPLMWLAYVLLCRDIELACDEKVIKDLGNEQRANYTQALVSCSVNRRMIAACPLAFGEVGVKDRVKSVMNYKKPAFWIVVVAIIACIVVAVCFLTNPAKPQDSLKLIDRDTPAGANEVIYSANFDNQVHSGWIYAEQWSNGECVRSSPVLLTKDVEKIYLRTDVRKEAGASVGVDVQIDTYGSGGSLITYFAYPEANAFLGWSFTARELNESVAVEPQKDIILAAMAFDAGNGIRAFDCQSLEIEPERLENADYMIVIRACFENESMLYNQPYGVVEVTYESPLTSFSMVAQENTPEYMLDENHHLYSVKEYSQAPDWTDLGEISEVTITKENFDDLFRDSSGDGWFNRESASSIRKNTAKAWSVIYDQERLYYILQQKNGELFLAYGYYDYSEKDDPGSDDTYIRWLYRLAPQSSPVSASVTKWFDYIESPEEMKWDGRLEINLPEFPDVTFRWYPEKMEAVTDDEIIPLYTGMPIWSAYFCDLTGDGMPDLCSALSMGSGLIDNRVIIYDYVNGASYELSDRGNFDYYLRLNEADGQLYVDKKANMDEELLSTGRLVFEDDCLQVLWPENQKNDFEPVYSEADNVQWSYEPKGINSDKVVELERIPEGLSWSNGIAATDVAPGEEVVSAETITVEEGETVLIHIQWSRLGLFMEYGLRSESGEEYFQEKQGGHSFLKFNGLPAGNYTIYAKNSDAYAGLPAYENPDMYDVNYDVEVLIVNYNISES